MNVIAARQFRPIIQGDAMRALIASIADENRRAWNDLVAVAQARPNQRQMTTLLQRIRNGSAFHYGNRGTDLADAYGERFAPAVLAAQDAANRSAQFSLGVDMDATRFYYADAAAQQVMNAQFTRNGATIEQVFELALQVNIALAALIGAFIRRRAAQ